MPIYSYIALKQGKEVVKGEVTASNLKDARDVIRKMGLVPTKISEYTDSKQKGSAGRLRYEKTFHRFQAFSQHCTGHQQLSYKTEPERKYYSGLC